MSFLSSLFARGPSAQQLIADGALVLDVRSPAEFAGTRHPLAKNIPVDALPGRIKEIEKLAGNDKARPIVVYCAAGGRASMAKSTLEQAGFTAVTNAGGVRSVM
jgi:phage shock protein E